METHEPLATGYGPDTPAGDNILNDVVLGLDEAFRRLGEARGDRMWEDGDLLLVDAGSPSLFANSALLRRPLAGDRAIKRMHQFYGAGEGGPFLLFSAWPTPDLTAEGFGRVGHLPLMWRPAGRPVALDQPAGVEIRPVHDAATARDWEWAVVHGYPLIELQPFEPGCLLPPAALGAESWFRWAGYLEGQPVGAAAAYVAHDHVDVHMVVTLEAGRRRGIGRALTATAMSAAPDRAAALIASDIGRLLYERLGFRSLLRFALWAGRRQPH